MTDYQLTKQSSGSKAKGAAEKRADPAKAKNKPGRNSGFGHRVRGGVGFQFTGETGGEPLPPGQGVARHFL